jgi:hypothetical protein
MKKILIALLSLSASFSLLAADGFSSLEEQMTGKEFNSAGLEKLSQSELESLNNWIRVHSVATLAAASTSPKGKNKPAEDDSTEDENDDDGKRTTITSTLIGKFSGWDGQTTFKLANGQIWSQDDKDKFYMKEVENPVVVIEPSMFGKWRLHIEGVDEDCRVKRIQ